MAKFLQTSSHNVRNTFKKKKKIQQQQLATFSQRNEDLIEKKKDLTKTTL